MVIDRAKLLGDESARLPTIGLVATALEVGGRPGGDESAEQDAHHDGSG
jgi:hypothetical protein